MSSLGRGYGIWQIHVTNVKSNSTASAYQPRLVQCALADMENALQRGNPRAGDLKQNLLELCLGREECRGRRSIVTDPV